MKHYSIQQTTNYPTTRLSNHHFTYLTIISPENFDKIPASTILVRSNQPSLGATTLDPWHYVSPPRPWPRGCRACAVELMRRRMVARRGAMASFSTSWELVRWVTRPERHVVTQGALMMVIWWLYGGYMVVIWWWYNGYMVVEKSDLRVVKWWLHDGCIVA